MVLYPFRSHTCLICHELLSNSKSRAVPGQVCDRGIIYLIFTEFLQPAPNRPSPNLKKRRGSRLPRRILREAGGKPRPTSIPETPTQQACTTTQTARERAAQALICPCWMHSRGTPKSFSNVSLPFSYQITKRVIPLQYSPQQLDSGLAARSDLAKPMVTSSAQLLVILWWIKFNLYLGKTSPRIVVRHFQAHPN